MDDTVDIRYENIDADLTIGLRDMAVDTRSHCFFFDDEITVLSVIRVDLSYSLAKRLEYDLAVCIGGFFIGISIAIGQFVVVFISFFNGKGIFTCSDQDIPDLFALDLVSRSSVFDKCLTERKMHDACIRSIGIFRSVVEDIVELTALDYCRTCSCDPAGRRRRDRTCGIRIRYEEKTCCRIVVDRLRVRNVPDDLPGNIFVDVFVFLRIVTGMVGICIHCHVVRSNFILGQLNVIRIQNIENDDRARIFDDVKTLCCLDCAFETAARLNIDIEGRILITFIAEIDRACGRIKDSVTVKSNMLQHLVGLVLEVLDHAVYIRFEVRFGESTIESFTFKASRVICEKVRRGKVRGSIDNELHGRGSLIVVFRAVGITESGFTSGDRCNDELRRSCSRKVDVAVIVLLVIEVVGRVSRLHVVPLFQSVGHDTEINGTAKY